MAKMMICANCGNVGKPKTKAKGSILIEVVLWLCFLVPGLLYSLWRLTTKSAVCGSCGAPNMVPSDSPRGKKLAQEFQAG
jgi:hypothetical protein